MVHRNLLKDFGRLPAKVQKQLSEFIEKFQKNPDDPILKLHPLKEMMKDSKVRGASIAGEYRAIIIRPERGDTYLLVHIDKHDDAYEWAKNKTFEVHPKTGVFQVFDTSDIEQVGFAEEQNYQVQVPEYALSHFTDDDLFMAGVPKPLLPAVKAIKSDEQLDALQTYLPPDCRDILYGMASGMTLDEALKEMLGAETSQAGNYDSGDFSNMNKAALYDLIFIEGEEELKETLKEKTLEEWRVFLHPYQNKIVEWDVNGPMSISGSAGTGKTVCLIHRAIRLARALPNKTDKILLTTYTTNLSIALKHQLTSVDADAAERIDVTNLHALSRTICIRQGWKGHVATDNDIKEIWSRLKTAYKNWDEHGFTPEEAREEYKMVIDPNGIDSEEGYLTTVRSGRGRMSRNQRRKLWEVFKLFQQELNKRNLLTFEGVVHQARMALENQDKPLYRHVLVDEIQDFGLEALRLINAISPPEVDNPLCVAGDGHQRIYRTNIPLSWAGIKVVGRSRRLKINYRTSEQIRKYAQSILHGFDVDDLDGNIAKTSGDHSVFQGQEPNIVACASEDEEARVIAEWVKSLIDSKQFESHEICVVPEKDTITQMLRALEVEVRALKPREYDPGKDEVGVRTGTMKRIKGLEFRAIAMACCDENDPLNNEDRRNMLETCERYVSATRAREQLMVTVAM